MGVPRTALAGAAGIAVLSALVYALKRVWLNKRYDDLDSEWQ
jgi:hypothetical protein